MGPRAWIILQSMTGSFFSLWPQLSTKRLFFPPGCGVSSFPWEGLCLLALSLPGCDESCNLSPGVMRLGFGASFIGMWCPHMPRQLRLLLPAACAKELAPHSQPASPSPRLVSPLLNPPLCSFPGPVGHLARRSKHCLA